MTLTRFALAWLAMWATCYLVVGVIMAVKGDYLSFVLYGFVAVLLGLGIVAYDTFATDTRWVSKPELERGVPIYPFRRVGEEIFSVLALVSVVSGVLSWLGMAAWPVPPENRPLADVSMAFADLLAAVWMLYLVIMAGEDQTPPGMHKS